MAKIKICGVTRKEDALLAAELGACAIGFIFFAKSPRYVDPRAVRAIAEALPAAVEKVGVFVNPGVEELTSAIQVAGLTRVQLHGDESPQFCRVTSLPVIKALRLPAKSAGDFRPFVRGFLLDADAPAGVWGGTGERADWSAAADFMRIERATHARVSRELWLAGGITAENAGRAIEEVAPYGLDISSGVESAPGIKDPEKLRALFAAVASRSKAERKRQ